MDNEAREKLHQTAALQCLLCGEDKAERIAEKIPQIVEQLRVVTRGLGEAAKHSMYSHLRDDAFDACALLDYIDRGERPL